MQNTFYVVPEMQLDFWAFLLRILLRRQLPWLPSRVLGIGRPRNVCWHRYRRGHPPVAQGRRRRVGPSIAGLPCFTAEAALAKQTQTAQHGKGSRSSEPTDLL